jgi:glycine cleavage system H protein
VSEIPEDLRYTTDHEWARMVGDDTVRIGITDYAQSSLGDIVFVSVHSLDAAVTAGETFGEVESTKSVSDLLAPVDGSVVTRNEALDEHPELVNTDPYGEGWIVELSVSDAGALDGLLDAESYRSATDG